MKKGIAIILAIAIIGAIAGYELSNGSSRNNSAPNSMGSSVSPSPNLSSSQPPAKGYKNGTFTGASEGTPYGNVQIAIVVSGGKITNVNFLQMPQDLGRSSQITNFSKPLLKQETLQKQSAGIDFVTGATVTSSGYQQSLQKALDQAAIS